MGNYLADGLSRGFELGSRAIDEKKRRELAERQLTQDALEKAAERSLRRELTEKGLGANAGVRDAQANNLNANAERTRSRIPGEVDELSARALQLKASANRTNTLAPLEADSLTENTRGARLGNNFKEATMDDELARAAERLKGDRLANAAKALQMSEAEKRLREGPTAEITEKFGENSTARFKVPIADAQRLSREGQYRSEYAGKIAQLGDQIATQQAELESGDERTGFLNLKSRKDEIGRAKSQQVRLQALEIQDMVNKGVISPEEGDRRAAGLLKKFSPAMP